MNESMGRKTKQNTKVLETDGMYLTKPKDIADHLSNFFDTKIRDIRTAMNLGEEENMSYQLINKVMVTRRCKFKCASVIEEDVKKLLLESKDKPSGTG